MNLIHTNYQNIDFRILTNELDLTLNEAIGGSEKRTDFEPYNTLETMDQVVLLYDNKTCVGCGAYRKYNDKTAEIKRMFVRPEYRGNHFSQILLDELIHTAKSVGYERLVLETGELLAASVHLYEQSGFYIIPNYPPYENTAVSLCMEKQLNKSIDIRYHTDKKFNSEELTALFQSVNWLSGNYPARLEQAINHSSTVISAWDGDKLIGLINALDDSSLTAYVHYLLVNPNYHGIGIGKTLLTHIKHKYRDYLCLLLMAESENVIGFYDNLGFTQSNSTPLVIKHQ